MRKVNLLDCTLRDGGYINDWNFGKDAIYDITRKIENTNVDVLEIGFLKEEPYNNDRTVFNSMEQVKPIIAPKKPNIQYAVMCEVLHAIPIEKLAPRDEESADIIRVIVWKTKHDENGNVVDALQEGYEYCKGVVERGYKLCVQPARVDQYSDEEFIEMIKLFSTLNPLAIYVVDSWGTQDSEHLLHYMNLADYNMPREIALGYHGHNNMLQAYGVAQDMIKVNFTRDIMIDASVYGIGRGAGNLNLEIIARFLNERMGAAYELAPMVEVNDLYIKNIFKEEQWGYSMPFFLTAKYNCNPNYARYYSIKKKLSDTQIQTILEGMDEFERVMFDVKLADQIQIRELKE